MKFSVLCLSILMMCQVAWSTELYPYKNPYIASLSFALARGGRHSYQDFSFKLRPERSDIFLVEGRGDFEFRLYRQNAKDSPLFILVPGIGGSINDGGANYLAEKLYDRGYSVAVFTNPSHWTFSLRASESGLTGLPREDARDLHWAIRESLNHLERKLPQFHYSSINYMGYSLGAYYGAFLAAEDFHRGTQGLEVLSFEKTVLLNPPVFMESIGRSLDEAILASLRWPKGRADRLMAAAIDRAQKVLALDPSDPLYFADLRRRLPFKDSDILYFISVVFRQTLGDGIFVSQLIDDMGVLKSKFSRYHRQERWDEIRRFGFTDFLKTFVFQRHLQSLYRPLSSSGVEDFYWYMSLDSVFREFKPGPGFHVLHTDDDILIGQDQLDVLQTHVPNFESLSRGGHLGYLWHSSFDRYLDRVVPVRPVP